MVIHRSFLYGDCFFETIAVRQGMVLFETLHYERIQKGLLLFKMEGDYSLDQFKSTIHDALGGLKNARIRVVFYRDAEGYYLPSANIFKTDSSVFSLPEELQTIATAGIFMEHLKPMTALSALKNPYAQVSVLASLHKQENNWNDALLLNTAGRLCESISGNVFVVRGGVIYTPPIEEGCVDGVMRKVLLGCLKDAEYPIEMAPITTIQLMESDEVFTTSTMHRMVSIQQIGDKKFGSLITEKIRSKAYQAL